MIEFSGLCGRVVTSALLGMMLTGASSAMAAPVLKLDVDATQVGRRLIHTHEQISVSGSSVTVSYPKWGPGDHAALAKVTQLGSIVFHAGGKVVPWRRDLVDGFSFHLDVPQGTTVVDADFEFLLPLPGAMMSTSSASILDLHWNSVLLYVAGTPVRDMPVDASLKLPEGWQFGTALPVERESGGTITFKTASLETLVDSPVLSGKYMRKIPLAPGEPLLHEMDVAAENEADLPSDPMLATRFGDLITQAKRLYGSEHYRDYHFLVNASSYLGGGGIEHHESSDDHVDGDFFHDPDVLLSAGSFLPHEYSHSWCGKYRRPADLYTQDYQQPMKTDLLWVYEGMDDYMAAILATRSGLWTPEQTREYWAAIAAQLDHETGRTWRTLQDTADSVPETMVALFSTQPGWASWLRVMDYYPEGILLWLDANSIIVEQSKGKRSLDDFAKIFFAGPNGVPAVKTYTEDDVVATLNQVAPYDWKGFFHERLTSLSARAPVAGFERSGWKLTYSTEPNIYMAANGRQGINAMYSLGLMAGKSGGISDVLRDGPAYAAGLVPGMKILTLNGQPWSPDALRKLIADSPGSAAPIEMTASFTGVTKSYSMTYRGGLRYPHLERIAGRPDGLSKLLAPLPAGQ